MELLDTEAAEIAGLIRELLAYAPAWAVRKYDLGVETDDAIDLLKGRRPPEENEPSLFDGLFRFSDSNFSNNDHAGPWVRLLLDKVLTPVDEEEIVTDIVKRIAMTGAFSYGSVDPLDSVTWTEDNLWIVSEEDVDEWLGNPDRNANRDWAFGIARNILGIK